MDIGSNVNQVVKIDDIIKKGLEDEVNAMKNIYSEIIAGIKELQKIITETKFKEITDAEGKDVVKPAKESINRFIADLAPLENLDARFTKLKEHTALLKNNLEEFKKTLHVYGSGEKAVIDFNNNIAYVFKTTILRDFEQDIDFNKRIEETLDSK